MDCAFELRVEQPREPTYPLRVYVAGHDAGSGKSSFCLGLLQHLVNSGTYDASELAYIKPATQCLKVQPVSKYCRKMGIATVKRSPVVFYSGLTQEYVDGTSESPSVLMERIVSAVDAISVGKKFVVVDGVGFASVGSILGISNASIARALNLPVVLVVPSPRSSLGFAIDAFNLSSCYFTAHGVDVVGLAITKVPADGSALLRDYVSRFFEQHQHLYRTRFLGLTSKHEALEFPHVSELASKLNSCQLVTEQALEMLPEDELRCQAIESTFVDGIDTMLLLAELRERFSSRSANR